MIKNIVLFFIFCGASVVFVTPVMAQQSERAIAAELIERAESKQPSTRADQIPSLMFTADEAALIASVRGGIIARPPTESEVDRSQKDEDSRVRGPRELALGGIIYKSSSDWVVWINGQKITPKRIPPEVLDIRVRKDHIRIRWFDSYTNQIFPIKLKPHQRFNIDTRIFLPG